MFADDANLFFSGKHIKTLFQTANIELKKKKSNLASSKQTFLK